MGSPKEKMQSLAVFDTCSVGTMIWKKFTGQVLRSHLTAIRIFPYQDIH